MSFLLAGIFNVQQASVDLLGEYVGKRLHLARESCFERFLLKLEFSVHLLGLFNHVAGINVFKIH